MQQPESDRLCGREHAGGVLAIGCHRPFHGTRDVSAANAQAVLPVAHHEFLRHCLQWVSSCGYRLVFSTVCCVSQYREREREIASVSIHKRALSVCLLVSQQCIFRTAVF